MEEEDRRIISVSSGFEDSSVARICWEGQSCKLGHKALMANFIAGCSSCSMTDSFVTNAVLIERAVSCWHLHQLISQTAHYLDSWLSDLLQSELKWNFWKSMGRVPVPHSWRCHCSRTNQRWIKVFGCRVVVMGQLPSFCFLPRNIKNYASEESFFLHSCAYVPLRTPTRKIQAMPTEALRTPCAPRTCGD